MKCNEVPEGCKVTILPDQFTTNESYDLEIIKRGNGCYILKNLTREKQGSDKIYRVQKRYIEPSYEGFSERLPNNAHYSRFDTLEEATKHFNKVEKGQALVMEIIRI